MKFSNNQKKNRLEKKLTILPAYSTDSGSGVDAGETTMDEEMEIVLNSVYGRNNHNVFTRSSPRKSTASNNNTNSLNSVPVDNKRNGRGSSGCFVRCLKVSIFMMIGIIILMFGFLVRKNAKDSMTPIPTSTSTNSAESQYFEDPTAQQQQVQQEGVIPVSTTTQDDVGEVVDEESNGDGQEAEEEQEQEDPNGGEEGEGKEEETNEDGLMEEQQQEDSNGKEEQEEKEDEEPEIFGAIEFVIKDLERNASLYPLDVCKGDCDRDEECGEGLGCRQRSRITDPVSVHCVGEPDPGTDYCVPLDELKKEQEENEQEEETEDEGEDQHSSSSNNSTFTSGGGQQQQQQQQQHHSNIPRVDYFQGCLPDRFDNEGMDLSVDPRYNFNQLRPGQFICSKPYRFKESEPDKIPQRYQFGMTQDGTAVVWRDIVENTTIVVLENPAGISGTATTASSEAQDGAGNVPYFSLTTDGTMVYNHPTDANQRLTLEPNHLQHPMSHTPRCLSNHDCPYFHIHSGGVLVLNYIAADGDGWQAKNFLKAYGL